MRRSFFYFSIAGWILSIVIHLSAIVWDYDLLGANPFFLIVPIGLFIAIAPAVFTIKFGSEPFFPSLFENPPRLLLIVALLGFAYTGVNFALMKSLLPGVPSVKDGQYILQN